MCMMCEVREEFRNASDGGVSEIVTGVFHAAVLEGQNRSEVIH